MVYRKKYLLVSFTLGSLLLQLFLLLHVHKWKENTERSWDHYTTERSWDHYTERSWDRFVGEKLLWKQEKRDISYRLLLDPLHKYNEWNLKTSLRQVVLIGSNFNGKFDNWGVQFSLCKYVFVVPHRVKTPVDLSTGKDLFLTDDLKWISRLVKFLTVRKEFDGAFGISSKKVTSHSSDIGLLEESPCTMLVRNRTIIIRNDGEVVQTLFGFSYQICNYAAGAFLIRKERFLETGWGQKYGSLSQVDFFLRTKSLLELIKLTNCRFNDSIQLQDRGDLQGQEFTEYQAFGRDHDILRIIYEDKIEWTKCAAVSELCKEAPYVKPHSLPGLALPICCAESLNRYLKDLKVALNNLGYEYRVVYGTLLGAVRNKTIIPWTYDVDVAVTRDNYWNASFYIKVQHALGDRYFAGWSHWDTYRMHPNYPTYLEADFKDIVRHRASELFTPLQLSAMDLVYPVHVSWRERCYLDFYPAPEVWMNGSAKVVINSEEYDTLTQIEYELKNWYGNYMEPIMKGNWRGLTDVGNV